MGTLPSLSRTDTLRASRALSHRAVRALAYRGPLYNLGFLVRNGDISPHMRLWHAYERCSLLLGHSTYRSRLDYMTLAYAVHERTGGYWGGIFRPPHLALDVVVPSATGMCGYVFLSDTPPLLRAHALTHAFEVCSTVVVVSHTTHLSLLSERYPAPLGLASMDEEGYIQLARSPTQDDGLLDSRALDRLYSRYTTPAEGHSPHGRELAYARGLLAKNNVKEYTNLPPALRYGATVAGLPYSSLRHLDEVMKQPVSEVLAHHNSTTKGTYHV